MAKDPTVTVDGVKYIPMSEEWYGELQAALEKNQRARHIAVEEFRLWCHTNKGTDTVEEGLRACTPDELLAAVYREVTVSGWYPTINFITVLVEHLNDRAQRAEQELLAAVQEPVVLEEE